MKASTQYNDFIGTSSADISDHTDLTKFLMSRGVDINRYEPIGASFYHGYNDFFTAYIICLDRIKTTASSPYIVNLYFENDITSQDFFDLFKRFHVIVLDKYGGHHNNQINEEITIPSINHK